MTKLAKHTVTTPKQTPAKAAKRTATRKPPVIDRAGVDFDSTPSPDDTPDTTPDPSDGGTDTTPTTGMPSAPSAAPVVIPASSTPAPIAPTTASSASTLPPLPAALSAAANAGAIDPSAVPVMGAAPTVSIPVPPSGFVPVPGIDLRGYRPMQAELASVPDAVLELGQVPNWGLIFGITAPAATSVAQRLQVAAQWTSLRAQSDAWSSYVNSQEGMAWKDALEVVNSLKPAFALATAASPAMLSQYPALTRLLGAQAVVAKRGAATKKRNAAAASAVPAAATTASSVGAPAEAGTATPARVVTVTG
jgi:hypothetical protein